MSDGAEKKQPRVSRQVVALQYEKKAFVTATMTYKIIEVINNPKMVVLLVWDSRHLHPPCEPCPRHCPKPAPG